MRVTNLAVLLALILVISARAAAAGAGEPDMTELRFVPAAASLIAECQATAQAVGYAVPCPMKVPLGLVPYGGRPGCEIQIIGPGKRCPDTALGTFTHESWRGWVVGSSITANDQLTITQHLVLTASPHPLTNYAKVVNGPAWYPTARVKVLGWADANGQRMREVYVSPETNEGSAFAGHVVLIWTTGGHTYGVGFHNLHGINSALALDLELVRSMKLVRPH